MAFGTPWWGRGGASRATSRSTARSTASRGPQRITQGGRTHEQNLSYYQPGGSASQARDWWIQSVPQGQRGDYGSFMASAANAGPAGPSSPAGPGGGRGYGYGGGGGGGGAPAMTQAMLDQMLAALGARGPALQLQNQNLPGFQGIPWQNLPAFRGQQWQNLPAFRGQQLAPFNPAQFNLATRQLNQAKAADLASIQRNETQTTGALQRNYTNAYANAPVAQGAQQAPVGVGLQQSAGGGGNQQAATDVNQAAAGDQASFQNLLNVLAAADQQAQASRLGEVAMNADTAEQALGAQTRGLGAGINLARAQAQQQWAQQNAERNYQNNLMAQQWARENIMGRNERAYQNNLMAQQWARENAMGRQDRAYQNRLMGQQWGRENAMRRQDIANQQAQGNWQQQNEMIANRIQPLLELIMGTGGANLNYSGIQNLLSQWGAGAR